MKKLLITILLPTCLFCFLTAAGLAEEATIKLSTEALNNLKLELSPVEKRVINREIKASGSTLLNENRVVEVVPRIAGIVAEVKLDIGAKVSKGDVLFRLESSALAKTITAYVDAENAMTFALASFEQEKQLAEKNLSSKEQLRGKELALKQAVSSHSHALQPLKLLHFNEATIHVYLSKSHDEDYTRLEVSSPGTGEVISRNLRRGASVEPNESLLTIADLSELWVDFFISLREIQSLNVGDKAVISSTVSQQTREVVISYIAPLADEQSRTVLVRALLKNADQQWRPGTPVVVTVQVSSSGKVLSVPAGAIVERGGESIVFVRGKEGGFSQVAIETGESDGTNTTVLSGVKEGQTVVSKNAAQLKGHLEMTAGE